MDSLNAPFSDNNELNRTKFHIIESIKSKFILKKIFINLNQKRLLETIKKNKRIQKQINLSINDFKKYCSIYSKIIIEITPIDNKGGKFINDIKKEEESYYHIYFDNNKEETKRYFLKENEKVSKIKIIIDYQIKSFYDLFKYCDCIYSICFPKFHRINITNMNGMFYFCSSLRKIDFTNFKTDNVKDMSNFFSSCSSLEELNLSNFNTSNVTNMNNMFSNCISLKKLNISNFNTSNVTNMNSMFKNCLSLEELNISNFNLEKTIKTSSMFGNCSNLKELNLFNLKNIDKCAIDNMFYGIPNKLKKKIESEKNQSKAHHFFETPNQLQDTYKEFDFFLKWVCENKIKYK